MFDGINDLYHKTDGHNKGLAGVEKEVVDSMRKIDNIDVSQMNENLIVKAIRSNVDTFYNAKSAIEELGRFFQHVWVVFYLNKVGIKIFVI